MFSRLSLKGFLDFGCRMGGESDTAYPAVVATDSLLVMATEVSQVTDDKQQLAPMVQALRVLNIDLGA